MWQRSVSETEVTPSQYPKALRIEVKFTTGSAIVLPKRELESLLSKDKAIVGAIAAIFWSGKRDVDGKWFIVDAAESLRVGAADVSSLDVQNLQRLERGQTWLASLRDYVGQTWPQFLRAFHDEALAGHETLCAELEALRKSDGLRERVAVEPVLDLEHRNAMRAIVESLGPSVSGHVFQDLLAYLLVLGGYRRVQINPIGVPDIEASEFEGHLRTDAFAVTLTREQIRRLASLSKAAGDSELAGLLTREFEIRKNAE